jgi:uncharacterized iron-regulated membrane protein
LHRWIGLIISPLVLVIALSGSLLAFEVNLRDWLEPYRFVRARSTQMLPPTELQTIAQEQWPEESASRVYYEGSERAAYVQFGDRKTTYYKLVYLDPYDGSILHSKDMNRDWLHVIFSLHLRMMLWRDIVDYTTLLFVVVLVTGLISWWPPSLQAARKRLVIRRRVSRERRIYDLHTVLGIYLLPLAMIMALTGLVWGFTWFNDVVRRVAAGGNPDLTILSAAEEWSVGDASIPPVDRGWALLSARYPNAETIIVFLPETADVPIRYVVNPDRPCYYRTDHFFLDPTTMRTTVPQESWGRYVDATRAGLVRRVNYDIHTGAILGLPGRLLVFCCGLLITSLPMTGVLIWWRRRCHRKLASER